MTTTVTFNGTNYSIPDAGELNWAALTAFLVDVGTNAATTVAASFGTRIATTSPVTVVVTDTIILTQLAVPAAVAITLPAGVANQVFMFVDRTGDAATYNITITPKDRKSVV